MGGGCLYRFEPSGRLAEQRDVPVERPTKLAFGGFLRDQIFVTSMSVNLDRPDEWGLAGALLRPERTVAGRPIPAAVI